MAEPRRPFPIARIVGTGRWLPATVRTNDDIAALGLDTSDERISALCGIRQRHIASPSDSTATMAAQAARRALDRAGVAADAVDAIVLSTATTDRLLPSTAVDVQAHLGATSAAAFDLAAACSGWLYGLSVAEGLLASGRAATVLVIGAEKMSAIIDWRDRATAPLFGDGAGAAVLQRSSTEAGVISSFMRSDGRLADLLQRPGGGASIPFGSYPASDGLHHVKMNGREIFKHAVRGMTEAAQEALRAAELDAGDVDVMIPHQANSRIIEATAAQAGIALDKVYINVDRCGNTSSASIPIALDEAIVAGRVGPGSRVLLTAFGAGATWASAVLRF